MQQTIKWLFETGCSVKVLQLGDLDLTSSAGKLILATLSGVAEMERDLLAERTQSRIAADQGGREAAWATKED